MIAANFKRFLISAHCAGRIPAWVVSVAFHIFKLKAK